TVVTKTPEHKSLSFGEEEKNEPLSFKNNGDKLTTLQQLYDEQDKVNMDWSNFKFWFKKIMDTDTEEDRREQAREKAPELFKDDEERVSNI
ncbi:MAG: hypothetical protein HQ538_02305, partial [Parcubacteria group bacterium]|nr:hypothetical protein [Parcubacteria group bacterium]